MAIDSLWENAEHIFCDNNKFSQAVLKKHYPNSKIYGDIKELNGNQVGTVDIVTGGFPCQPFSIAGKQRGKQDERYLWGEMFRVIKETRPTWIVGENVAALTRFQEFEAVCADLEAEGYEVQPFVIPACAVGANHRRDRVWIVAYSDRNWESRNSINEQERQGFMGNGADSMRVRRQGLQQLRKNLAEDKGGKKSATRSIDKLLDGSDQWRAWPFKPFLRREDDGIPNRVDRIIALGNSIVPQVAAEILKALK